MLSSPANFRRTIPCLLLVLTGCLVAPIGLNCQQDPASKQPDQEASKQTDKAASPQPGTGQLPAATQAKLDKLEDALTAARASGDAKAEAKTLNEIGRLHYLASNSQKAIDEYNQSLPIIREVGDRGDEAGTLTSIGIVYSALGEKQKALEYYNQALPIRREVGDRGDEAGTLTSIGAVYSGLGEKQKALEYYNQALPIYRAVGGRSGEASTGQLMGDFYRRWAEGAGKVTRVEALRQAQLDLLLGKARAQGDGGKRGFDTSEPATVAPAGYAHPYYRAPFVLMENSK